MRRAPTRRGLLATVGTALVAGCSQQTVDAGTDDQATAEAESDGIPYDVAVDHDLAAWDGYDPDWSPPTDAPTDEGIEATVLVENLEIAWDMAFAPNGEVFLTERTGSIRRFEELGDGGEVVAEPDAVVDAETGTDGWVVEGGEGGLLGVDVHPSYPDVPLVYAYFTTERDGERTNEVHAFDVTADDPDERSWPIVTGIPGHTFHNGGRIQFGPANYLWVAGTDGDPGLDNPERIRDPGNLSGAVLRVEPDGSAPADNPDIDGGDPRIFTYGHRNPQGLSWLPDGTPVITEHGPSAGDEVNVLRPGADYGWPTARNDPGHEPYAEHDFQPPVADAPAWGPSGSVFYTGDAVPAWRNRLLVSGLISQQIVGVTIAGADGDTDLAPEHETLHDDDWFDGEYRAGSSPLFQDVLGRVRSLTQGPDGALYATTSNRDGRAEGDFPRERDDVLVRIEPAGE